MLRYFQKDLRTFILVELKNIDFKLTNFFSIVKNAVIAKPKVNLRSWTTIKNIN